ncbi:MAG: hypothetical protein WCH32_13590 [Pseudomonadota bacterium]
MTPSRPKGFVRAAWLAFAATLLGICGLLAPLAGHAGTTTFDHFTTGFDLIGQHKSVPCESCHVGGIFKGTPKDCFSCHAAGSRIGATSKPTNHILSGNDCAQCHTPYGWRPVAKFNHINVLGTCSSCHNGVQSVGKPSTHIPTTAECSTCHIVQLPWKAAHYDHAGITDNCVRCHDNVHAPGKPQTHVPTTNACETCHGPTNFTTFAGTPMNHAGIVDNCQACHETGMSWYGVQMVDRPTAAQDPGHPTATSPGGADCKSCHAGFNVGDFAKANKPRNHIPYASTAQCSSCHVLNDLSIMGTLGAIHANAPSSTTNCQVCHGMNSAQFDLPAIGFHIVGLPGNHMPTSVSCEVCHAGPGSSFPGVPVQDGAKFTNSLMNHAGSTTCAGCHGKTVTGFVGVNQIIVMPPTSPMGVGSHIPSSEACETCHAPSAPAGYIAPNATTTQSTSGFLNYLPKTGEIHAGMRSGCTSCHEGGNTWMGMDKYPINPNVFIITTQYTGFLTRPASAASQFQILDAAHPSTGDCVACHGTNFNYFDSQVKPDNHIPTSPTATCSNCHNGNLGDFSQFPTRANIHLYAPSQTTNCVQCHGTTQAASFAIPAVNFRITSMTQTAAGGAVKHMPTAQACESCHVGPGSSVTGTVQDNSVFAGSTMNHAGITTCAGCHGSAITVSSFTGISKIIVIPPRTPAGSSSAHIPTSDACESCHLPSMPSTSVPANATATASTSLFGSYLPLTAEIHAGLTATSGCQSCHEGGYAWMGMSKYPISPSTFVSGQQYIGFQTRPGATASTFVVKDAAHPSSGDCGSCHGANFNYFESAVKPSNHIPYATAATCGNCHTAADFSVMPALSNIHQYAQSTTTNCVQCHGTTQAATYAIPAANFKITTMIAFANGGAVKHVPTTQGCELCHVGAGSSVAATVLDTSLFSGSKFSHQGLTTCVACHGPAINSSSFTGISNIIVMPATSPAGAATSHIPSSTACEACHLPSMPSSSVPANSAMTASTSLFGSYLATTMQIHSGLSASSTCQNCHEGGYAWLGMGRYPIAPSTFVVGQQYTGFQTRPGATASTFVVKDAAHPSSGDCGSCHGANFNYFDSSVKPSNHIPYATAATCANCHTAADFSVMPTLSNIHQYAQSRTTNCVQCHGTTQAATYAIPAANFKITTMIAIAGGGAVTHLPTAQACELCHVGAGSSVATTVLDTSKFSGSKFSHSGVTTCVSCHGPTVSPSSFTGIAKIIVEPPTTPAGAATSHIPSSTACETCHQGSMPSGLIAASSTALVPGSLFGTTGIPTTTQIHSGITTGCQNCHEGGYAWMGMNKYPISPATLSTNSATQYIGFQTRPGKAAGTYMILDAAHPVSGDCYTCHGTNVNYFSGQALPTNHIPILTGAACSTCHTTAGNFAVYTTNMTTLHTAVSTTCSTCHADGKGPFAGATGFKIVMMSTKGLHIPITNKGIAVECSGCHVVTTFSGTIMKHAAIGDTPSSAAGNACDACHEFGYANRFFGITINWVRPDPNHEGGKDCVGSGCHANGANGQSTKFKNMKNVVRPPAGTKPGVAGPRAVAGSGALRAGMDAADRPVRRLGGAIGGSLAAAGFVPGTPVDHNALGGRSCQTCHNGVLATGVGASHPKTTTVCADCHSSVAWSPVMHIDHADVLGSCVSCHNGKGAAGKPANHLMSGADCDRCHTASAWKPAAVDHVGILPGTCATCHNGLQAVTKSARHVLTILSCDTCHYVLSWSPVKPQPALVRRSIPRLPIVPRGRQSTTALPQ